MTKKKKMETSTTSTKSSTVKEQIDTVGARMTAVMKPTTISKSELKKIVDGLPEPKMDPTRRWYGETFYPTYDKAYAKLKRLVET